MDFGGRVKLSSVYNFILQPVEAPKGQAKKTKLSVTKDEEEQDSTDVAAESKTAESSPDLTAPPTSASTWVEGEVELKEEQQATSYPLLVGHFSPERITCDYSWPLGSIQAFGIAIAVIDGRKGKMQQSHPCLTFCVYSLSETIVFFRLARYLGNQRLSEASKPRRATSCVHIECFLVESVELDQVQLILHTVNGALHRSNGRFPKE